MFGLSKSTFLGIDFGTSSIKAVELALKGKGEKPAVINYGEVSLADLENSGAPEGRSYEEEVTLHLRALLQKFKPKSRAACVAMPAFIGLISVIDFPEMEDGELEEAVRYEAKRFIPSAFEDIVLNWEVVRRSQDAEGKTRLEILVVAALKKEVEKYRTYISEAGLKMELLELETFSLARALVGEKPGLILLIDIGSRSTNLVLAHDGGVCVSRNLNVGGNDVTHTLMESLNINWERAEVQKKSGKDYLNEPVSALVFPALEMIVAEATRMLEVYKAKYPGLACSELVLSGGSSGLAGLPMYLNRMLGVPVTQGDPWARVTLPESEREALAGRRGAFTVALGLALNEWDARERERKSPPEHKPSKLKALLNKQI